MYVRDMLQRHRESWFGTFATVTVRHHGLWPVCVRACQVWSAADLTTVETAKLAAPLATLSTRKRRITALAVSNPCWTDPTRGTSITAEVNAKVLKGSEERTNSQGKQRKKSKAGAKKKKKKQSETANMKKAGVGHGAGAGAAASKSAKRKKERQKRPKKQRRG